MNQVSDFARQPYLEVAEKMDLPQILKLQKEAYLEEARLYDDFSIPPLLQTIEDLQEEMNTHLFLKLTDKREIIGSVRGCQRANTCLIGKLIVKPARQNMGYGKRLLQAIELRFASTKRYQLFTGAKSIKNLYLYHAKGYHEFDRRKISEKLTLVYLEKLRQAPGV